MAREKPLGSTRRDHHGYILVKVAEKPRLWLYEHRVVWEAVNGPLPPGAIIHHKNGCKSDNRLDNLELCRSVSEHMGHHPERTQEHRAKIAAAQIGHIHSAETKAQMSASAKSLWQSEERRARQSAKIRKRRALPPETQARIRSLRADGLSLAKIAESVFGKRSAAPRVCAFLKGGRSRY